MKFKIYYINRYSSEKQQNIKDHSGYEQVVKYSELFRPVKSNILISKLVFKFLKIEKPKDYRELNSSDELKSLFKALITGNPVFYLYADKDAFLLPLLKRKYNIKRIKLFGTLHWPLENSQEFAFYKHNLENQFNGIIALSSSLNPTESKSRIVIPHGIDLDYWKNDNPPAYENSYLILGISNRDHLGQMEIMTKIKKIDPYAKFILLMQNKVIYDQYNVIPEIKIITERVSDDGLKQLYATCKAVILIQNHCLASNVVLECISMKTPLITNRVGDIQEYLGTDYPLFLDECRSEDKLYNICYSPDLRKDAVNYLSQIRNKFDWKAITGKTVDFIKNN